MKGSLLYGVVNCDVNVVVMEENEFNKLGLHQTFVQARLHKGYRYLDLSGVVLNRIGGLYEEVNIAPAGGILRKRKNVRDPYAIRFSAETIWLHYAPVESLGYIVDTANEWIQSIAKDIEVRNFGSLGIRSQFFVKSNDIIKSSTWLAKRISGEFLQEIIEDVSEERDTGISYMVRVPIKKFVAVIRMNIIRVVREAVEPIDYPSDGMIFDVDIYWRRGGNNTIPRAETKGFIRAASDQTYVLLDNIGYKLMGEGNG